MLNEDYQLNQQIKIPGQIGKQGKYHYYSAAVPVADMLQWISFAYEQDAPEKRAQRVASPKRVKAVADYILDNPDTYVFNAVTLIVRLPKKGQNIPFQALEALPNLGQICLPEGAEIYPVDGQHRIKGWKRLMGKGGLEQETIQCIFWEEATLNRAQQIFHDINHNAAKPSTSLALYYDHNKGSSQLPRSVIAKIPFLEKYTDLERSTVTDQSKFLFPYAAMHELVNKHLLFESKLDYSKRLHLATDYLGALIQHIKPWRQMAENQNIDIVALKQGSLAFKAVTLCALGAIGNKLCRQDNWREKLADLGLEAINWSLDNTDWDGVVRFDNRLVKNAKAIEGLAIFLMAQEKPTPVASSS